MKQSDVKLWIGVWMLMILLVFPVGPAASAENGETAQKTFDDYRVIFERNIFSKDRQPPRSTQPQRVRTTQVLAIYVLRGTAVEQDERIAFIEEQISGQTMKAEVGTEVLNGRITEIRFNGVRFEQDGQTKYVRVGGEFGKNESTVVKTVTEETDAADDTASAPAQEPSETPADTGSSGDQSDILKKLMERRQSELGQ